MSKLVFVLETLTCPSCIKKIEHAAAKLEGVEKVNVLFHSSKVQVRFDETKIDIKRIEQLIVKLGYPILSRKAA